MHTTRRILISAFAAAAVAVATPALALKPPPPLSAEDKALVDKAAAYLDALASAKGRFTQIDARGAVSHGELYIQRPGKARFAYDPPASLLIVSNGNSVRVLNRKLKTFNSYPLAATPLSLFLSRHVRLDKGVKVTRVVRQPGQFSITARDGSGKAGGWIQLTFSDSPVALREWTVMDAQGATTRVRVEGLQAAGGLDPKLFVLNDPRPRPGT
jgi:outer membrane lipoprotein-sorting protein